jgi:hypothetical protein
MAPVAELFAWAVPVWDGAPVDHTWVTTYDNRKTPYPDIGAVQQQSQSYWYCWGAFHAKGGTPDIADGFLGAQDGDLGLSKCLVLPNIDCQSSAAARGTIFIYGVSGVCHQLANQVLYSTGAGGATPLTVSKSRGYWFSHLVYGAYGVDTVAWAQKLATCGAVPPHVADAGVTTVPNLPDEFEQRAREILGDDPKLLGQFLALRADTLRFAAQKWPGSTPPSAEALNARNQALLEQAEILLGPERFAQFFGFQPGQKVDLVDPKMLESFRRR